MASTGERVEKAADVEIRVAKGALAPGALAGAYVLSTAINIPLCIVLIIIMREVANVQRGGIYEEVFA